MTSFLDASVPDARLEVGATAYHPTVWGTPVNPETKLLLLTHALDHLGAGRVQLKPDVRNVRAPHAIATRRALRRNLASLSPHGSVRDTVLFAVTSTTDRTSKSACSDEWLRRRNTEHRALTLIPRPRSKYAP